MNTNNKPQELDAEELLTKVADLYKIEGEVSSEVATAIDILRQLINEEFVPRGKMVSSQFIYDIVYPAIAQRIAEQVEAEKQNLIITMIQNQEQITRAWERYRGNKTYGDFVKGYVKWIEADDNDVDYPDENEARLKEQA